MPGNVRSRVIAFRPIFACRHYRVIAILFDQAFESVVVADLDQRSCKAAVVLDDQKYAIARTDSLRSSLTMICILASSPAFGFGLKSDQRRVRFF